ncbi:hypothetical protein DB32_008838 [Sandaracinus amylolyticus]|uniref:Uncharacterized protein n=2 Tax=Sandaracinus amylolyticus TaxID=927083 RepID=A0A0F6SI72_9BACT|nr:hypothetical protein DB32_008838 [Sandaracinus amylolyticus]
MRRVVAWALSLMVVAIAARAGAQDRVVATYRIDAWDRADVSWAPGATVRVLLRGTLSNAIDGSEIDAMHVTTASRSMEDASPLVFPAGARLIEQRGPHAYLVEVPAGAGATIGLNVPALAARHLVTVSELRASLSGVIVAEVLGDEAAPIVHDAPTAAVVEPRVSPAGLAGAVTLSVPLLVLGIVLARRRRHDHDAALMARVTKARAAIAREAKVLGAAFDGAFASASALVDAATRQRAHLVELDRAIGRSAWVRSEAASATLSTMHARRAEARAKLESIVAQLEETVVRMAACVADRSAIAGLERDLARARSEVEVGESVEAEIARI